MTPKQIASVIELLPEPVLDALAARIADKVAAKITGTPELVSRTDLAKALSVSERTIERRVAEGKIPSQRVGSRVLFNVAEVVASLQTASN